MKSEFFRVLVPMVALSSATLAFFFGIGFLEDTRFGMSGTLWLVFAVGAGNVHLHLQNQTRILRLEDEVKQRRAT